MKADVTMQQVWYNTGLLHFFFRQQAIDTLEELLNRSIYDWDTTLNIIDGQSDEDSMDLSEIEEYCYNDSVEDVAERFSINLIK